MVISDRRIYSALMEGKSIRRVAWEDKPHRPYFVKVKTYRNMLMLYDDEGAEYQPEIVDLIAGDWEVSK